MAGTDGSQQQSKRRSAEDAAIEWIARLRADDVTDAERADFATWLATDANNKAAFDEMADLWGISARVIAEPALDERDEVARARRRRRRRAAKRFAPMAAAATVAMAFLGALLLWPNPSVQTETGEQRRVVLEDGTTVHLNTRTKIEIVYTRDERGVILESGEAYFEVAKNPNRPFRVYTNDGFAEVLGTAFNVHARLDGTEVAVSEGRVAVQNCEQTHAILTVAQSAEIDPDELSIEHAEVDAIGAWRSGRLIYDGVTLSNVVADLNRYVPTTMSLADDHLADVEVSAVLELQEQEAMLDALAESLNLRWKSVSDNLILLKSR